MKTGLIKKISAAALVATMFVTCTAFSTEKATKSAANAVTAITHIHNDQVCPNRGTYYGEWSSYTEDEPGLMWSSETRTRRVYTYCIVCGRTISSYEQKQVRILCFYIPVTPWMDCQ